VKLATQEFGSGRFSIYEPAVGRRPHKTAAAGPREIPTVTRSNSNVKIQISQILMLLAGLAIGMEGHCADFPSSPEVIKLGVSVGPHTRLDMIEFNPKAWLVTEAVGLPALALLVWRRWKQAQSGGLSRFNLCILVACLITPCVVVHNFGGIICVEVFPAWWGLPTFLVGVFRMEQGMIGAGVTMGILPILVVSLVLVAIWAMIAKRKEGQRDIAA